MSVFFTSSCHNKEPLIDAVCLSCALVETIRPPALRAPCRCGGAFARAAGRRVVLLLGGAAGRGPAGCARGAQKSAIRAYAPERLALFPRTNSRVALNSNVQRKDAHGFTRAGARTRRTVCGDTKNKGEEREVYYLHSGAREALLELLLPAALPRDDRAERRERRTG